MTDLAVDLGFCTLQNPVIAASGTFGYALEFQPFLDLNRLGGFVVKGLYYHPRPGNPPPRLVETAGGLINAIGLQGIGVERFAEDILPRLQGLESALIVNVCGDHDEEYVAVVETLNGLEGITAYELNISCPNVEQGGRCPAMDPEATYRIVKTVKKVSRRPCITKLTPNAADISGVAVSAQEAGSDALSLVNTFLALAVDAESRRPELANVLGGLSGPAIKPLALRMVYQVAASVSVPVIGMGGIMSGADAVEFLIAGASAVQVGTANFVDPQATLNVIAGLEDYGRRHGLEKISVLTGALRI